VSERPLIRPVRASLWIGGGFVLIAGVQLFGFPGRTDELFAWTIGSKMSAAFLGSFYLLAAVLALGSARQETWARARLGVPGALAFVWLTLLATLLHLDLFHLDEGPVTAQIAAWVWLVIYAVEPPLLAIAFWLQLRAPGGNPPRPRPLPGPFRGFLVLQAAVVAALGAVLFVVPLDVAEIWPWELTELTGRAIAAWVLALGGLLAAIAWEDERSRIRLGIYTIAALVILQVITLARFGDELDSSTASAVIYLISLAGLGVTGAWGWRISTG
jgi:hypothetical protein